MQTNHFHCLFCANIQHHEQLLTKKRRKYNFTNTASVVLPLRLPLYLQISNNSRETAPVIFKLATNLVRLPL